jgi:hypothetical protein
LRGLTVKTDGMREATPRSADYSLNPMEKLLPEPPETAEG